MKFNELKDFTEKMVKYGFGSITVQMKPSYELNATLTTDGLPLILEKCKAYSDETPNAEFKIYSHRLEMENEDIAARITNIFDKYSLSENMSKHLDAEAEIKAELKFMQVDGLIQYKIEENDEFRCSAESFTVAVNLPWSGLEILSVLLPKA